MKKWKHPHDISAYSFNGKGLLYRRCRGGERRASCVFRGEARSSALPEFAYEVWKVTGAYLVVQRKGKDRSVENVHQYAQEAYQDARDSRAALGTTHRIVKGRGRHDCCELIPTKRAPNDATWHPASELPSVSGVSDQRYQDYSRVYSRHIPKVPRQDV